MDIRDKKCRKYLLTLNNPNKHDLSLSDVINTLTEMTTTYFCVAKEIALTGTEHYHVFIYSKSPIKFSTVQRKFPTAHIEFSKGSIHENRDYVAKEGKWAGTKKSETSVEGSFFESGVVPEEVEKQKSYPEKLLDEINAGNTNLNIIQKIPSALFRIRDMEAYRQEVLKATVGKEIRKVNVTYMFGNSGIDKMKHIYERHSMNDIYRISANYNGRELMFDDYAGNKVVVLEDFNSQISIGELVKYLEGYPLYLKARYTNRVACYTEFYILSDAMLEEQYHDIQGHNRDAWEAFNKHINRVEECLMDGTTRIIRG